MMWIDIENRLPPQDMYVLIATIDPLGTGLWTYVQIAARSGTEWTDATSGKVIKFMESKVTHWMKIPDPPGMVADLDCPQS